MMTLLGVRRSSSHAHGALLFSLISARLPLPCRKPNSLIAGNALHTSDRWVNGCNKTKTKS
jgi:hypothetical protein